MPPSDSNSTTIVITGASTGIGAASALELARRGFRVFAGIRREADGQRLLSQTSGSLIPLHLDVTEPDSIRSAAETVAEAVGDTGLGGLVNNAGIVIAGPVEILPVEELRRQLEVNVIGAVSVTQAFLPLLRASTGRIVNISSLNGSVSTPYLGAYCASKFALEALSDSLRNELRKWNIEVSVVIPGAIDTPIWEKARTEADQMAEVVCSESVKLYEADLAAMRTATEQFARNAIPVEKVVQAIVRALTAKRPKPRYFVPFQTRLLCVPFRQVPDRIRDWFIRRALGLR